MRGIYLQGGGAKGAFQAGVIYRLYEKGLSFNVLSGTSIGAINSYFIYTDNLEKLKNIWTNIDGYMKDTENSNNKDLKVIDNSMLINILKDLNGIDNRIKTIYVNYVKVMGNLLKEQVVNISKLSKDESVKSIKYSSLLPCRPEQNKREVAAISFNSQNLFDNFKIDLDEGLYDGYKLDGGILNNNLLSPFIKDKVEELYIITFKKDYEIPPYILKEYQREQIKVIEPSVEFKAGDTLRFEREFCKDMFYEGYNIFK